MANKPKSADSRRCAAPYRAPELPADVLHAIFLPLAGDISTLCAAACVNKSWRDAALHPRLWAKLVLHPPVPIGGRAISWQRGRWGHQLNDARLAVLVRRACAVDPEGNAHTLRSLHATHSKEVTLRSVLAALRGPRDDAGKPLLRGALRTLQVAGVRHHFTSGDDELITTLSGFLRPSRVQKGLDIFGGIWPCTKEKPHGSDTFCGRVASLVSHSCEDCDVALCGNCAPSGCSGDKRFCEHMCGDCNCIIDDDAGMCVSCDAKGCRQKHYCHRCITLGCAGDCGGDDEGGWCNNCLGSGGLDDCFVWCEGCGDMYCQDYCAFGGWFMTMCRGGPGELAPGCADSYCYKCADQNLTFYEDDDADGPCWALCHTCSRVADPSAEALREVLRLRYSDGLVPCSPRSSSDDDAA